MPKRSDNLETTLMMIELLRRIPQRTKTTTTALHQHLLSQGFERDVRTIQRLLNTICSEDFGVECTREGNQNTYRFLDRAKGLSIPSMSKDESLMLMLAKMHLRNLLPPKLMKSMEPFFSHARNKLLDGIEVKAEKEWLAKVRVVSETQPLLPPEIKPEVFEAVTNTLYANLRLDLVYINKRDKKISGRVSPLGLVQQGAWLYLVCQFDEPRKHPDPSEPPKQHMLALHRFISAIETGFTIDPTIEFNLDDYIAKGNFGYGAGPKIELSFNIIEGKEKHLLESKLSKDQTVEVFPNHYRITATVIENPVLERWLLSLGDDIFDIRRKLITASP